jgi:hypothetical protein
MILAYDRGERPGGTARASSPTSGSIYARRSTKRDRFVFQAPVASCHPRALRESYHDRKDLPRASARFRRGSTRASRGTRRRPLQAQDGGPNRSGGRPAGRKALGFYQFHHLERWDDGRIALTFSVHRDEAESYGQPPVPNLYRRTRGKPGRAAGRPGQRRAATTERRSPEDCHSKPAPVNSLSLPPSVGVHVHSCGKIPSTLYPLKDLPDALGKVYLSRLARGDSAWVEERSPLRDPSHSAMRSGGSSRWSGGGTFGSMPMGV